MQIRFHGELISAAGSQNAAADTDRAHNDMIDSLVFTDEDDLISLGRDCHLKKWNVSSKECVQSHFFGEWNILGNALLNPVDPNQLFFTAGNEKKHSILLWDIEKGKVCKEVENDSEMTIVSAEFDETGARLLLGDFCSIWNTIYSVVATENWTTRFKLCGIAAPEEEDPDPLEADDIELSIIEKASFHLATGKIYGIDDYDRFARWSSEGSFERFLLEDSEFDFWRSETCVHIFCVASIANGEMLAAVQDADKIKIVQLEAGNILQSISCDTKLYSIGVSQGSNVMAIGLEDGTIVVLNLKTGDLEMIKGESRATSIAFSPTASRLAVGRLNGMISVFEIA